MSEQKVLTKSTKVNGNVALYEQFYKIVHYEAEEEKPEKVALYINWNPVPKHETVKSLYFVSPIQLKDLIADLTKAYMFFAERQKPKEKTLLQFRTEVLLPTFFNFLKTKMAEDWRR